MLTPFSMINGAIRQPDMMEMGSKAKCTDDFLYLRLNYQKLPDEIYKQDKPIDLVCFLLPTDPSWSEGKVHDLMEPIPVMSA